VLVGGGFGVWLGGARCRWAAAAPGGLGASLGGVSGGGGGGGAAG